MKRITLSIDDKTYRLARIAAAERSMTVSAMVREYLRYVAHSSADPARVLFSIMDRAQGLRAADRLTRDRPMTADPVLGSNVLLSRLYPPRNSKHTAPGSLRASVSR